MKLKGIVVASIAVSALATSALADNYPMMHNWGAGFLIDIGNSDTSALLQGVYLTKQFMATAMVGYTRAKNPAELGGGSPNALTVGSAFKMRSPLNNTLNFDYGVGLTYSFVSANASKDPYQIGPVVGFDFVAAQNFLITADITPAAYERNILNQKTWSFFQTGSIGFNYMFA